MNSTLPSLQGYWLQRGWPYGPTTRVSVASDGQQGNDHSSFQRIPSISADGRYVAFESDANNLVEDDTNGYSDIFVHDRLTGETTLVSVSSAGQQGNGNSGHNDYLSISADGRYVAFASEADNLVEDDTNGECDVFVHDRQTGETTRVSVASSGQQGDGDSKHPSISADGRYVAFMSTASNFGWPDMYHYWDVFVHDRQTGETDLVSVKNIIGWPGNSHSFSPSISADGRYVAFVSIATDLVEDDTNGKYDVFVRDRQTEQTILVSVASGGQQGNGDSKLPSISADGRYVAFSSLANNLVEGDTYGGIFVHDRQTGQTGRAGRGGDPGISADGRYVAFDSGSSNLVEGDTNGYVDIFVHDCFGY